MGRGVGCIESTALIEASRWLRGAEPWESTSVGYGVPPPPEKLQRTSNTIVLPLIFGIWFRIFPIGTARRPIQLLSATRRTSRLWTVGIAWCTLQPNTHRRRRRDETVELRRVGIGGVYMNSQLTYDDCRRIRWCERSRRPWPSLQFCS